jgi:hypothetical protein
MGRWGDFPDTGLESRPEPTLKKSGPDSGDVDLERMFKAMEILERRAQKMSKAQLYTLNQKIGEAVNRFHKAVMDHVCRPRPGQPVKFYAGERVSLDANGMRVKIVQFLDADHLLVEFEQDLPAKAGLGKNK